MELGSSMVQILAHYRKVWDCNRGFIIFQEYFVKSVRPKGMFLKKTQVKRSVTQAVLRLEYKDSAWSCGYNELKNVRN